jgi:shikimate dehydrogenase
MSAGPLKFALIGQGIQYSRSPELHRLFAQSLGLSITYELHDIPETEFEAHLRALQDQGYHGCNVTQPFKHRAFAAATQRSVEAERSLTANTLRFGPNGLSAHSTDGPGLIAHLSELGIPIARQHLLILGAGGSASALLAALHPEGPASLWISNRTLSAIPILQDVHTSLNLWDPAKPPALRLDGMIDCTSLRTHLHPTLAALRPHQFPRWVYDLKYTDPMPTLDWAKAIPAVQFHSGFGLLVHQAALAFEYWTGLMPRLDLRSLSQSWVS